MNEHIEQMRRRLDFLMKEREQKLAELHYLEQQFKFTSYRGILSALLGDASLDLLRQQQILNRIQDLNAEIRKLNFEIENLKAELSKKGKEDSKTEEASNQLPSDFYSESSYGEASYQFNITWKEDNEEEA